MICFVAQPFRHPYQQRYDEVFKPAIEAAGLEPYKVDLDPGADKLIDDIEAGIKRADVCLIDITENNPNVWFELGYSQALVKPLVLVSCPAERTEGAYPFDVRGRKVIDYATAGPSDYAKLQTAITTRIKALLERAAKLEVIQASPVTPSSGLDPHSLMVVAVVLGECPLPEDAVSTHVLSSELERLGYSKQGIGIAIRHARFHGMLATRKVVNDHGDDYQGYYLSTKGEEFVLSNPDLFTIKREPDEGPPPRGGWGATRSQNRW